MRKIFFILFGIVLVVLIFLVDWREKYEAITGKNSGDAPSLGAPLGRLESDDPAADDLQTVSDDSLWDMSLENALDEAAVSTALPETDLQSDPLLSDQMPAAGSPRRLRRGSNVLSGKNLPASPGGLSSSRAFSGMPPGSATRPIFQDVPEQPYMDESRQLLRQTVRNYDRIIASEPRPPQ